jgi:hypothetical protein
VRQRRDIPFFNERILTQRSPSTSKVHKGEGRRKKGEERSKKQKMRNKK